MNNSFDYNRRIALQLTIHVFSDFAESLHGSELGVNELHARDELRFVRTLF
jgi:hypothetical protein